MILKDIPKGGSVFVDANIFISEILEERETVDECLDFLERIKNNEIKGFTSIIVLNEIFHRIAIAEAHISFDIPLQRTITFLKENPKSFRSLDKPWKAIENIANIPNLIILYVNFDLFSRGLEFSKKYGILSNDALHLAVMNGNNLVNLASNDSDFERVDWINLCKPSKKK